MYSNNNKLKYVVVSKKHGKKLKKVVDAKGRIFENLGAVPQCDNAQVAADLTDDSSLAEGLQSAGFKTSAPSVFLAEGLIMYLMEGASWKGKVCRCGSADQPSRFLYHRHILILIYL